MSFQKIVVIIAIVILILLLTWIGYAMYKNQHSGKWPPVNSACPDYWDAGESNKCTNTKHLGNCKTGNDNVMDFSSPVFQGADGRCAKYRWAKSCGVSWSGLTDDPNICYENSNDDN
tara:strand:+ start:168 stop:518 length:351 start_codon:yes stop_codon:yes gene_type:complete